MNFSPAPHKDKGIRKLITELVRDGWVILGGRKHYKVRSPKGHTLSVSNSPGCPYALKHIEADVRRIKRIEENEFIVIHSTL
mgnify:CR=1 FL=1